MKERDCSKDKRKTFQGKVAENRCLLLTKKLILASMQPLMNSQDLDHFGRMKLGFTLVQPWSSLVEGDEQTDWPKSQTGME